jgi:rhodanese-related sulfurtransferase
MRSAAELVRDALSQVRSLEVGEALRLLDDPTVLFVDIREAAELRAEGLIPGAFHAPRGLLEFWVDPASEWFQPAFGQGRHCLLYCAAGWRSALAAKALQDMGMPAVSHLHGGFNAWKSARAPVCEAP